MKFATILADPPWKTTTGSLRGPMGFSGARGPTRPLPYPSMSVEEIAALPVASIAGSDAHLYLCTINKYVEDAYRVARAWGFTPSTLLTWAKATMGGGLGGTFGISSEYVLFCRRGSLKALRREPRTWFSWKRPYDHRGKPRHSAKPPELYRLIEGVSPGPRAELFARAPREGWECWGNEVQSTVILGAPDGSVASLCAAPPTTAVKQLVGSERAERAPNASNHRNPAITSREVTPGVAGAGGPGAEEGAPGRTRST